MEEEIWNGHFECSKPTASRRVSPYHFSILISLSDGCRWLGASVWIFSQQFYLISDPVVLLIQRNPGLFSSFEISNRDERVLPPTKAQASRAQERSKLCQVENFRDVLERSISKFSLSLNSHQFQAQLSPLSKKKIQFQRMCFLCQWRNGYAWEVRSGKRKWRRERVSYYLRVPSWLEFCECRPKQCVVPVLNDRLIDLVGCKDGVGSDGKSWDPGNSYPPNEIHLVPSLPLGNDLHLHPSLWIPSSLGWHGRSSRTD